MAENNILEYIFGIEYAMIPQINNDNFYSNTNEYCPSLYATPASTPAWTTVFIPHPTIVFIAKDIGKPGIDIGSCDNNNEYEISNGMSDIIIVA